MELTSREKLGNSLIDPPSPSVAAFEDLVLDDKPSRPSCGPPYRDLAAVGHFDPLLLGVLLPKRAGPHGICQIDKNCAVSHADRLIRQRAIQLLDPFAQVRLATDAAEQISVGR